MDLKSLNKLKETQISYDETRKMYFMDLGLYKFFAEQIYYNVGGIERFFNKINSQTKYDFFYIEGGQDFKYEDIIISRTLFYNFYIYSFQDIVLNKRYSFITNDVKFYNFRIFDKDYYLIVYLDVKGELKQITNFEQEGFELKINNKEFIIINKIFGTEILNINLDLKKPFVDFFENYVDNKDSSKMLSVADFYIFEDNFGDSDFSSYYSFFKKINNKAINCYKNNVNRSTDSYIVIKFTKNDNPLYPYGKIEIKYKPDGQVSFSECFGKEIQKLFFGFFYENYLAIIINNKEFEKYFSGITNLSQINFKNGIDKFNFKNIDIYSYDNNSILFKNSFNYLKYLLYTLNDNLLKIDKITGELDSSNPHFELFKTRNIINKESIEKNIIYFESVFKKYLELIGKFKGNN